jgi:hypothetical protein
MFILGDVIRNKKTGIAYLICYINPVCILVEDMRDKSDPAMLFAILPRDYAHYAKDTDMNCYAVKRYQYWLDDKMIFTLATKIRLH